MGWRTASLRQFDDFYEFIGLSSAEQSLALTALDYWESLIDVSFSPTNGSTIADITFQNSEPGAYAESAVQYWNGVITNSTVNIGADWISQYGTGLDSYSFQTYVHEIGHALGLGHAGNYNRNASYASDALYLNDSWATTIMSYFDQQENTYFAQSGFNSALFGTPMLADIVTIQRLYGAGDARIGNTTYGFNISGAPGYTTPPCTPKSHTRYMIPGAAIRSTTAASVLTSLSI